MRSSASSPTSCATIPTLGMRRVWTWLDWPGRLAAGIRATDLGIDLVAEDELGELVGVQVKFRLDPRSHLRWEEVSTALGFRPDLFARRLIVTNAADRTANARRATEMTPNTGWVLREDLLASPIDWTGALAAGTGEAVPVRLVREPRPVPGDRRRRRRRRARRPRAGPARHGLRVGQDPRHAAGSPRRGPTSASSSSSPPSCSSSSSAASGARPRRSRSSISPSAPMPTRWSRDEWRVRADELGVPVTTDPAAIAAFLRGPGRRVVFATYASSARIAEAQADSTVPAFDLVVADEAHRIAGHRERRRPPGARPPRRPRRGPHPGEPAAVRHRDPACLRAGDTAALRRSRGCRGRLDGRRGAVRARSPTSSGSAQAVDLERSHRLPSSSRVLVTDEEVADLVRERAGVIVDGRRARRRDAGHAHRRPSRHRRPRAHPGDHVPPHHRPCPGVRPRRWRSSSWRRRHRTPQHISGAMSVDDRERVLARPQGARTARPS